MYQYKGGNCVNISSSVKYHPINPKTPLRILANVSSYTEVGVTKLNNVAAVACVSPLRDGITSQLDIFSDRYCILTHHTKNR
jgi:hypothetical protein